MLLWCKYIIAILFCTLFLTSCESNSNQKKIGLVLPIEHQALNEIVAGFKDNLTKNANLPFDIHIKVENAQGDINLQRAIIQQMKDQQYDLIVPIGLAATETALSLTRTEAVLSLAANIDEKMRTRITPCHLAIVHDEISPSILITFIKSVYPEAKQITLIHSTAEKIYPDVKLAIKTGKQYGINIQPLMVTNLSELYNVAQAVPANSDAILILKDNLIVSGISTLVRVADRKNIPLLSADQGSVENGADFALGMPERKIGEEGAKLAALILQGKPICDLSIIEPKQLTIFINQQQLHQHKISMQAIRKAAEQNHYQLNIVNTIQSNK